MANKLKEMAAKKNIMEPGSRACAGCAATATLSHLLNALDNEGKKVVLVVPASCWLINIGVAPHSVLHGKVTVYNSLFASAAATAGAFADKLKLENRHKEIIVVVFAGDGSTYDIGFASVSGAAARNKNILYVVNDNEAYQNTGNQDSAATPLGTITTTTPKGASTGHNKKDIDIIMAAHNIPYVATVSLGSVNLMYDFYAKIKKAAHMEGFRFIHSFNPCPTGWKAKSSDSEKLAKLAVASKVFPIVEFEASVGKWRVTYEVKKTAELEEYLKLQGRFADLSAEEITNLKKFYEKRYAFFKNS